VLDLLDGHHALVRQDHANVLHELVELLLRQLCPRGSDCFVKPDIEAYADPHDTGTAGRFGPAEPAPEGRPQQEQQAQVIAPDPGRSAQHDAGIVHEAMKAQFPAFEHALSHSAEQGRQSGPQ